MLALLKHEDKKKTREREKKNARQIYVGDKKLYREKQISKRSRTDWPLGAAKGLVVD